VVRRVLCHVLSCGCRPHSLLRDGQAGPDHASPRAVQIARACISVSIADPGSTQLAGGYVAIRGKNSDLDATHMMRILTGGNTLRLDHNQDPEWFSTIKSYTANDWFVSTGTHSEQQSEDKVIGGHAYSVLKAVEVEGRRLMLLRNTHGCTEPTLPWHDGDECWGQHPEIAEACGMQDAADGDDGLFWIEDSDFASRYNGLNLCSLPSDDLPHSQTLDGTFEMDTSTPPYNTSNVLGNTQIFLETADASPRLNVRLVFTRKCTESVRFILAPVDSSPTNGIFGSELQGAVTATWSRDDVIDNIGQGTVPDARFMYCFTH